MTELVRHLNTKGEISKETFTVNFTEQDRKGNPLLESKRRKVRSHPSRILPLVKGAALVFRGSISSNGGGDKSQPALLAKCPTCGNSIRVDIKNVRQAECAEHGAFDLSWAKITAGRIPVSNDITDGKPLKKASVKKKPAKTRAPRVAKAPVAIDFDRLRTAGELWTRSAEFDYPAFDVRAHVLILSGNGKTPPRKYYFNSYNGTWGKKPKDHDLSCFLDNCRTETGAIVGWVMKGTLEQERRKLTKSGYQRDNG
jgi:hypothetical protein